MVYQKKLLVSRAATALREPRANTYHSSMDLTRELLAFFREGAGSEMKVDESSRLLELGLLDSVRILALADLLAAKAGYRLEASSLKRENFQDVRSIVKLVRSRPKRPTRRGAQET